MKDYIPTINISSLLNKNFNSISSNNTIKKIEKACVEVGFFQIITRILIKKILMILSIQKKLFQLIY